MIVLKFIALVYSVVVSLKALDVWSIVMTAAEKRLAKQGDELTLTTRIFSFCVCMAYANLPTIWLFNQ